MFKILIAIVLVPLLYVVVNILIAVLTKYKPEPVEDLEVDKSVVVSKQVSNENEELKFLIWNIGYGGLGADVDFFYDDGKMVITPESLVRKYINGIYATIEEFKDYDFILLQEVDVNSKRSHGINIADGILSFLPDHHSIFAKNYDVKFLPFPWTEPMGKIQSGLLSCSKLEPEEALRIAFPGITDFPRKLFYLERCVIFSRYNLENGKDLIVINTHLEAYDDGGIKRQQMQVMKEWVTKEYEMGNYVVIGGDWNIAPPDFDVHKWEKEKIEDKLYLMNNDPDYIQGWKYAYDGNTPTNRKNNHPFNDQTFTTVIDYFLLSPNIELIEVKGVDVGFENSDHNPVAMRVKLIR
jgi:endonuclease/exonuclease/phosphatase family metal-dependent hydrolase